tara:strand:- start:2035 stop:2901 length:867 start_codon:yes stop_codon:yes gene_type:complete
MKNLCLIFLCLFSLFSCSQADVKKEEVEIEPTKEVIYTRKSELKNEYIRFSSPNAINRLAEIENEYFKAYYDSTNSRYYGTTWSEVAVNRFGEADTINDFQKYLNDFETKPDSMHCTIYAIEALRFGMSGEFEKLEAKHKDLWGEREHAGWSMAYLLTKYYNWKAILVVSEFSPEYKSCVKNYKKDKKYHVWKQPNIPIDELYVLEEDDIKVDSVLNENEFGWGFSYQGYHTWITRFDTLKECNWSGAPSIEYAYGFDDPLFKKTKFTDYYDYGSHIIVFPPKELLEN